MMAVVLLGGVAATDASGQTTSYEDMFVISHVAPGVRVPTERPVVGNILVDSRTVDIELLLERMLGENRKMRPYQGFTRVIDQGSRIWSNNAGQEIEIYPHGGFVYRHPFASAGAHITPITRREAERMVDQFLSYLGGMPPNAELVRTGEFRSDAMRMAADASGLPLGYYYQYGRREGDILVRSDHIQVNVVGGRITYLSWSWGVTTEVSEEKEQTIPASKAVQLAVEYVYREVFAGKYYANVWVSNIRLVYWYDGLEEAWRTDGDKRLAPVWEVDINDGALRLVIHAHSSRIMKFF
ncbi:hypothetical protein IIA16_00575 [bacterium]|nr:hypothetical protein [bacterium]